MPRRLRKRHPRVRPAAYLTALAVAVAAVLAACGGAPRRGDASPAASSPVPSPTQVTATPPPAGPSTVKTPPVSRPGQGTCRASDFRLVSINSDGAMGGMYTTVAVVYQGSYSCHMVSTPMLQYGTSAGHLAQVPTVPESGGPDTLTVQPGQRLFFVVRTVNGYGGYDPKSPECAHPATYRQIQVRLGEGDLALGDWQLAVLCGQISVRNWAPGTAP